MNVTMMVLLALVAQVTSESTATEAKAKAQALLKEGARLYERGDLADALEKFEQAYAAYPSPKLLFNIGQTTRGLGRPVTALEAFERFLEEATDAPADMAAEARMSVSELQAKVGRLLIECPVQGAEITVDGKGVGLAPVTNLIRVTPGTHQVAARHENAGSAYESVDVIAGTVHTVVIRLQPLAANDAKPEAAKPAAEPDLRARPATEPSVATPVVAAQDATVSTATASASPTESGWWLGRKWTWVAAGSSVVLAGTAVAFGLSMQSEFDRLVRKCGGNCSEGEIDSVALRRDVANVCWGLAGAAAATAGVLFFLEGRRLSVAPMAGKATGLLARVEY